MKHCQNKSNLAVIQDYLNGERPFTQVGYVPVEVRRKIGEEWEDSHGITWRQENGYKTRVNKQADLIRDARKQTCKCGKDIRWGSRFDQVFYVKTGLCEDCLIDYETKLRILGIYNDYEKYKMLSNQLGTFLDAEAKIKETIKFFKEDSGDVKMICNSEGFIERWKNTNRDQILQDAKQDLILARKRIAEVRKERRIYKKKYRETAVKCGLSVYGR